MPRVRVRHGRLYYRNTFLVWTFAFSSLLVVANSRVQPFALLWVIPLLGMNFILWQVYLSTHPLRLRQPPFTPQDAMLSYEEVTLTTGDGLKLTGWYVPGKNRAAVVLAHGLGGSKVLMLNHARALAFDDYGVLMLDLRAHGGSEGDTITGVNEAEDVLAGVEYLRSRPDVDADKIGALGVSLGAVAVLRAARRSESLRAVLLEGLGPTCLADHGGPPKNFWRKTIYSINRFTYSLLDWFCGGRIAEGVRETLPHIWPRPVFLVAAGRGHEARFNRIIYQNARDPKELWEAPNARHAAVYLHEPLTYRDKMRAFFRRALLGAQV